MKEIKRDTQIKRNWGRERKKQKAETIDKCKERKRERERETERGIEWER